VRHQGDRPTCVGFAVSAAHEWIARDATIRSAEDAMWAGHKMHDVPGREETSVRGALEGLAAHGHCTETAWPYGSPRYTSGRPEAALDPANRRGLPRWRVLGTLTVPAIRAELERAHAVILSVKVVRSAWRQAGGKIDAPPGQKTPGNHAVLAVGVLDDPTRVIIKNSWGAAWGDGGYGFISEGYLNSYGLRAHILEAK
jgi:hypothetical protein